ncbi:MAG TPA: hypothetical protein VMU34_09145, partial [Mycobacterium sp.]|nr:hypothetical protein [Mycobacterium sp.]
GGEGPRVVGLLPATARRPHRLVVRGSGGAVGNATFDIPHFVMEQKMLRGIGDRARAHTDS